MNTTLITSSSFVIGIMLGLILCVLIFKAFNKNHKAKTQYDERQEALRGRAYKYAAYTAWGLIAFFMAVKTSEVRLPMDDVMALFTIMVISMMVQMSYSIWNDAYWGINNNIRKYVLFFILIAAINIIITVVYAVDHSLIVDGILTWRGINAVCALMFLLIGIQFAIKSRINKPEEEYDYEES